MPVAGKLYTTKVLLPNYPEEAYVVIYTNPKADLFTAASQAETGTLGQNTFLAKLIQEWNFTDEKGEVLPITPENVEKSLGGVEQAYIMDALKLPQSFLAPQKKSS